MAKVKEKRIPGLLTPDGKWFVLVRESTGSSAKGYTHQCGEEILAKSVPCSIHDGPFPLTGHGEVQMVVVPYCLKCEREPASGTISSDKRLSIWGSDDEAINAEVLLDLRALLKEESRG